jgi:hypothetical protein
VLEALLKRVDGLEAQLKEARSGEQTPVGSPKQSDESVPDVLDDGDKEGPNRKYLARDSGSNTPSPEPSGFMTSTPIAKQ